MIGAVAVKLCFMALLGERMFFDALRSMVFARALVDGTASIYTHVENTKTFIGPVLWFQAYSLGGTGALRAINLLAFCVLAALQYRIGRRFLDSRTALGAVFIAGFYVGTHKNVVAGETDDMAASLFFTIGVWLFLGRRPLFVVGVLMGVAFLFKFWGAILSAGFVGHLLLTGRRSGVGRALSGMALPIGLVSLFDQSASIQALFLSVDRQQGFSDLAGLAFKLISTGLLPAAALSAWSVAKFGGDHRRLMASIQITYLVYVLLMRDAYAASYVMMPCLVFSALPIAEFVLRSPYVSGRRSALAALAILYLLATSAMTYHNFYSDTRPADLDQFEREVTPVDSFLLELRSS